MQSITLRKRGRKLLSVFVLVGLTVPVVSLATSNDVDVSSDFEHRCILPAIQPNASSKCATEAAAYAAAIVSLNSAQQVANDAYRAWYECEITGGGNSRPSVEVPPAELSVLVQE